MGSFARPVIFAWAACLLVLFGPSPGSAAPSSDFATIYQQVKPSVVYIVVATASGAQSGSGFVYDSDADHSIIVTANHVIADAQQIDVIFDSNVKLRFRARPIEHDRVKDVAFLDVPYGNRKPLRLMERTGISEGNSVAAIGYPRAARQFRDIEGDDLRPSVHGGIISAVRLGGEIVQFDAQTDHGDSGGPVIDTKTGRVVGIVRGALLDRSYAARGLENPLPGSSFAESATTIYAVRNGLVTAASGNGAALTTLSGPGSAESSASYRVAFAAPRGQNSVIQSIDDEFTQRIREHFTGGNTFYAIPGSNLVYGEESTKIAEYCDGLRVNAIVAPYYGMRADAALAGNASVTVGLLVSDCYGIPFFSATQSKAESRMFANRTPVREVLDMGNDLIDKLLAQFESYRLSHDAAWTALLKTGIAVDPNSTRPPLLVGIVATDHQYRVRFMREGGLGAKSGLKIGDILVSIDGAKLNPQLTAFEVTQQLERSSTVLVRRPEGDTMIHLGV